LYPSLSGIALRIDGAITWSIKHKTQPTKQMVLIKRSTPKSQTANLSISPQEQRRPRFSSR
jgi:hypothetical protein